MVFDKKRNLRVNMVPEVNNQIQKPNQNLEHHFSTKLQKTRAEREGDHGIGSGEAESRE